MPVKCAEPRRGSLGLGHLEISLFCIFQVDASDRLQVLHGCAWKQSALRLLRFFDKAQLHLHCAQRGALHPGDPRCLTAQGWLIQAVWLYEAVSLQSLHVGASLSCTGQTPVEVGLKTGARHRCVAGCRDGTPA